LIMHEKGEMLVDDLGTEGTTKEMLKYVYIK
jgi:hypothetical protein